MSATLMEPVERPAPVDWYTTVTSALASVGVLHVAPAVSNTLATLNSYSAAPLSLYTAVATGLKDAQVHVALLRALDATVARWPASVRRQVCAPPLPSTDTAPSCQRERSQNRSSAPCVEVEGIRPLSEAVVLLYNAAVANVEAALTVLDRVRAGAARRSGHSLPACASEAAASLHAPSVNAKAAYKHFVMARQLALGAAALLMGPTGYGVGLSTMETQYVRSHMDVEGLHAIVRLGVATCKYVYALFSSTSATNPGALAGLAFTASTVTIPASVTAPSLHLLPAILLATYHLHRAEYYYQLDAREPDMANALGHLQLADATLREVQRQAADSGATPSTPTTPVAPTLKARLQTILHLLTPSPLKTSAGGTADASESDGDSAENPTGAADGEGFLAGLADYARGDAALRVFPVLDVLLRRMHELRQTYERENRIVYFHRPAPIAAVQADVPDLAEDDGEADALAEAVAAVLPDPHSVIDAGVMAQLPSAEELHACAAATETRAQHHAALQEAVDRLSAVAARVQALDLPPEAALALEALQPCWEPHTGSVCAALELSQGAVRQAWARHMTAVEGWTQAQATLLGRPDGVDPPDLTLSLEAEVQCWMTEVGEAREQWARAMGPLTVASTCSATILRHTLLPYEAAAQDFLSRCTALLHEVAGLEGNSADAGEGEGWWAGSDRKRLRREASPPLRRSIDAVVGELSVLEKEGTHLLARVQLVCGGSALAERAAALRAVALSIWDAPQVVGRLDEATARLEEEAVEATVTAAAREKVMGAKAAAAPRGRGAKAARAKTTPECAAGTGQVPAKAPRVMKAAKKEVVRRAKGTRQKKKTSGGDPEADQ